MVNKVYAAEWLQKALHDLTGAKILYELMTVKIDLDDEEVYLLSIATTYQTKQRYPVVPKVLPSKQEIEEILCFSEKLFERVCSMLEIDAIE